MKRLAATLPVSALFAVLLLCSCASRAKVLPDWLMEEMQWFREHCENLGDDVEIHLSLWPIKSFDERTILAGGSYRNGAGSCRSALLRSTDGGRTWKDLDVWACGCEVCNIYFFDAKHVWFAACWSIEGNQAPYHVFRSTDGGETWQRSETELPTHIEISLSWITDLSFSNPMRGRIAFKSTVGDFQTYTTDDGGMTWTLESSVKVDPEEEVDVVSPEPRFKHEVDSQAGIVYIKSSEDSGKTYKTIGSLPYYYTFKDLQITPRPTK